jgi:hypothetical protein
VIILAAALLLPSLFWDKGPETIDLLRRAQIARISVSPSVADSWKRISGITIDVEDPSHLTKVPTPGVEFHARVASATRAPWVNSNGWRFLRNPEGHFFYEAPGPAAALAVAEAFAFGVRATIRTDDAGLEPFGKMVAFVQQAGERDLSPLVNIGFVDDGSDASGEFMNLLIRRNLLFKVVVHPDPKLDLNVALGSPQYPKSEASNPSLLAETVRSNLTDQKRLLRVYGSEVVVARLLGNDDSARLFLINYSASRSPVHGLRVRILGQYRKPEALQYDSANLPLQDISSDSDAIEFTLPQLDTFAIIDLAR